jgi:hypothetical protein
LTACGDPAGFLFDPVPNGTYEVQLTGVPTTWTKSANVGLTVTTGQTAEAPFYVFPPNGAGASAAETPAGAGTQATPTAPTTGPTPVDGERNEGGESREQGDGQSMGPPPGDPGLAAMSGGGSRGLDLRPDQGGDHD